MSTIVIAEDYEQLQLLYRRLFEAEGYTVICVADGQALIEQADLLQPDVILSDRTMPEMDGIDALVELRASARTMHIPFVFQTASPDPRFVSEATALGAFQVLIKPVALDELVQVVAEALLSAQPTI